VNDLPSIINESRFKNLLNYYGIRKDWQYENLVISLTCSLWPFNLFNHSGNSCHHNILWSIHFPIIRPPVNLTCINPASHIGQYYSRVEYIVLTFFMENQSDGSYEKSCIHDFPKIQTQLLHYHIGATFRLLLWHAGRAYALRLLQPFYGLHSLEKGKRAKSYYSCLTRRNPRKLYWKLSVVLYRMAFLILRRSNTMVSS
jgi:hypothetical protein